MSTVPLLLRLPSKWFTEFFSESFDTPSSIGMSNTADPLFFRLPEAWLASFLSEWLEMPSIGMLDTAMSSKKHREQFLKSLQNMRSSSIDGFCQRAVYGFLVGFDRWKMYLWRWLSIRQIFVERIKLNTNDVRSDFVIPSLREAVANFSEDADLCYLVNNCPALRSLTLAFAEVSHVGLGMLTNLHGSLEEFSLSIPMRKTNDPSFTYGKQFAATLVDMLCGCSHLQKVSLTGESLRCFANYDDLLPFGHLFHELQLKRWGRSVTFFPDLLTTCTNLRELRYECHGMEQDVMVWTAICHCPLLTVLRIINSLPNQEDHRIRIADLFGHISRSCRHLRDLSLDSCRIPISILQSVAGMENLRTLSVADFDGLPDAGMAVLATTRLEILSFATDKCSADVSLQSLVGSNISQTLVILVVLSTGSDPLVDDVRLATALASCHNLKTLRVYYESCLFGSEGLQAVAAGCPLLKDVSLYFTVEGIHYLGEHVASLQQVAACNGCARGSHTPAGFPSVQKLQTLYPAVKWVYGN